MSPFEVFYLTVIAGLCAFGAHRYWLVWESWRRPSLPTPEPREGTPTVLVQLPVFNECVEHVARLLQSAAALDWPRESLEIQLLDDSTDGSSEALAEEVARLSAKGVPVVQIRRTDRAGYKAGALAEGLLESDAEFVAIFDADFVIPADFLVRALPEFGDDNVAMVQARWAFLNEDANLLTRVQSVMLDGHFRIDHKARSRSGRFFNFNGTAGVWRRRAIDDVGGWTYDNITEDLDLSLRVWLAGWESRYLDDLPVPSELPEGMPEYKVQQNRWVSGSVQTACRYLPALLWGRHSRRRLSWVEKLDTLGYLTGNATYLLLLLLAFSIPPAILLRLDAAGHFLLWLDAPFVLFATLSVYVYAARVRGTRRALPYYALRLPALMALGLGMTLHNTRAIVKGALGRARVFERTPKGEVARTQKRSRRLDPIPWLEGFMALYVLACVGVCVRIDSFLGIPFLALFAAGYGSVLWASRRRSVATAS